MLAFWFVLCVAGAAWGVVTALREILSESTAEHWNDGAHQGRYTRDRRATPRESDSIAEQWFDTPGGK